MRIARKHDFHDPTQDPRVLDKIKAARFTYGDVWDHLVASAEAQESSNNIAGLPDDHPLRRRALALYSAAITMERLMREQAEKKNK